MARVVETVDKFSFERALVMQCQWPIAGVDEAGRGPLAGPVVAAAVIFPKMWIESGLPAQLAGLNDSKQLTPKARAHFFEMITSSADVIYEIAVVDSQVIDSINILQATHRAMNVALAGLSVFPMHVLVDGTRVNSMRFPQTPLVKGDSRSYSIAAASVLAKVTRDRMMERYDAEFPGYGFAVHKGYGTPVHLEAIARLGPSAIHRLSFAPLKSEQAGLF